MNNVTLVFVILCTQKMVIYCNSKFLHWTVILVLLGKILYLEGKRGS